MDTVQDMVACDRPGPQMVEAVKYYQPSAGASTAWDAVACFVGLLAASIGPAVAGTNGQ